VNYPRTKWDDARLDRVSHILTKIMWASAAAGMICLVAGLVHGPLFIVGVLCIIIFCCILWLTLLIWSEQSRRVHDQLLRLLDRLTDRESEH
jgi:energy-converting hydrogenase Eha subunit C